MIWDLINKKEYRRIKDGAGGVAQIAFVDDATDLVVQTRWQSSEETTEDDQPETATVWNLDELQPIKRFNGRADVEALASKKPYLVLCHEKTLSVRSANSGFVVSELSINLANVRTHPSGWLWAGAKDNHLCIFRLEGAESVPTSAPFAVFDDLDKSRDAIHANVAKIGKNTGWMWHNDNYVTHKAICPACGRGGKFGSRKGYTDLRVRFEPGEARSFDRRIVEMRIKCGDSKKCMTGVRNSGSGLVLIPYHSGGWLREQVRGYLFSIASPLASHKSLEDIPLRDTDVSTVLA